MKKEKNIRKRLLAGAVVLMLAILFGGCGFKHKSFSVKEAKGHVSDWLYDKYGEDFTITEFKKKVGNSGPFGGNPFYYFEAISNDTGVSFSGTTSYYYKPDVENHYRISDRYEEALYEERLEKEIADIPNNLDKWGDLAQSIYCYRGREMKEKSADYEAFKADSDKVSITVSYRLHSDDMEAILPELYDYLKTIYDINKDVTLSIYNVGTPTGAKGIDLIDADDFTFNYLKQELTF